MFERVLVVLAFYSFAGWVYIAANASNHPNTLRLPLTHLVSWPHEDTFGTICFGLSFVSAMLVAVLRGRRA